MRSARKSGTLLYNEVRSDVIKKKLCLIGPFGVGKTSLIRQYVENIFSDTYLSTVGVKIDKKKVHLTEDTDVLLLIWDLEGIDDFNTFHTNYLEGMSGYFLVADGTRPETLKIVNKIARSLAEQYPEIPSILLVNKADLTEDWNIDIPQIEQSAENKIAAFVTSAKTGEGVETAFLEAARAMIAHGN